MLRTPSAERSGPSRTGAAVALARNRELLRVAHSSFLLGEACASLGLDADDLRARIERGELVGVRILGDEWWIPDWQFDPASPDGLLAGIAELAHSFPGTGVALSRWMVDPNPNLAGLTPRAAVAAGGLGEVLALLEGYPEPPPPR